MILQKRRPSGTVALLMIVVLVLPMMLAMVSVVHAQDETFSIRAGQSASESLRGCASITQQGEGLGSGISMQASASGDAAGWVSPSSVDFGYLAYGSCGYAPYTITVPADTPTGDYSLVWQDTCQTVGGAASCSGGTHIIDISVTGITTTSSCPPGDIMGGLPSSPICYPPGMKVVGTGDYSVVDLSDSPVTSFVSGDVASTGSNSMLAVSYQSSGIQIGPNTVVGWIPVTGNAANGYTSYSNDSQYYITFDQIVAQFGVTLATAGATHVALHLLGQLVVDGELAAATVAPPITMLEIAHGELHLTDNVIQYTQNAVTCITSGYVLACPDPAELAVNAQNNGTSVSVISGKMLVASLATGNYTTLQAGQTLFVPSNLTQASQQNLKQNVQTFSPSQMNQWWTALPAQSTTGTSTQPNMAYNTLYVVAGAVLIAIAVVVALRARRKGKGTAESEEAVIPSTAMAAPQTEAQPQVQPGVSMETLDKMTKLKALLDSGAISAEEYTRMKKSVLEAGTAATQPSYAAPVAPMKPATNETAVDKSALKKVLLAGILWLVGLGVVAISIGYMMNTATGLLGCALNSVNQLGTSSCSSLTGDYSAIISASVITGFGGILSLAAFVVFRSAFRALKTIDPRFSRPASLTKYLYAGIALLVVALVAVLAILSSAARIATDYSIIMVAALVGGILVLISGIMILVGFIGMLLGIWRLGSRYHKLLFKIAVLFLMAPPLLSIGWAFTSYSSIVTGASLPSLTPFVSLTFLLSAIAPVLVIAAAVSARKGIVAPQIARAAPALEARPKQPKEGKMKGPVIAVIVIVIVVLAGLASYEAYLKPGWQSTPSTSSAPSASLFTGAVFYNGTVPPPASVSYVQPNGTEETVDAIPGWVLIFTSPSAAPSAVNSIVSQYGGSLLSYIPAVGFYLADSGSQNESAFITEVGSASMVRCAGPDLIGVRAPALGTPIFIDWGHFEYSELMDDMNSMAQTSPDVVTVLVDSFTYPDSHGFQVAKALDATNPQMSYIEVQDDPSSGYLSMDKSIATIIAVINAAQDTGKKVVINYSTYGECLPHSLDCTNTYAWETFENQLATALEGLSMVPYSWIGKGNVIINQAAGNGRIDLSSALNALDSNSMASPIMRNVLQVCGMLSADGFNRSSYSNYGAGTTASNPLKVVFAHPSGSYVDYTSYAAPVCSADAFTLWSKYPQLTASQIIKAFKDSANATSGLSVLDYQQALTAVQKEWGIPTTTGVAGIPQGGKWDVSSKVQVSASESGTTTSVSGSGSGTIYVAGDGTISGSGTGQYTMDVKTNTGYGCVGSGTQSFTSTETYAGWVNETGWGSFLVTIKYNYAPSSYTETCTDAATGYSVTYTIPFPSPAGYVQGGSYTWQFISGNTYTYKFSYPAVSVTGDSTFTITRG